MKIKCVWEHNGNDSMLYSSNYVGAFSRGETLEIAIRKMKGEVEAFQAWKNEALDGDLELQIEQEWASELDICDADTDVIFEEEKVPQCQINTVVLFLQR